MVFKAKLAIEPLGSSIVSLDLQMQRVNAQLAAGRFGKQHRLLSNALMPIRRLDK